MLFQVQLYVTLESIGQKIGCNEIALSENMSCGRPLHCIIMNVESEGMTS
jgi:hypothetical protein